MSVQFILGRSGTGKTSFCIKAIVEALLEPADSRSLILLVPEQATYQAERAILGDKRVAGYSGGTSFCKESTKGEPRLNVLSFDRLQFLLLGKKTARPALSRIGQEMIIHRILRDNSSKLKVFGSSASWLGLGRQMARTIAELQQYAKTPDDIEQLLGELQKDEHNNLTALKFADINLVFKEYLKFIEGRFIDPDIQLTCARRAVAESSFAKGAKLWVDGFAGFTTAELAVLAELLSVVADAQIAFCLDPSKIDLVNPDAGKRDPASLFSPTERTYADVIEIAKKCKLQLAKPVILERPVRFSCSAVLAHIERNIFELETPKLETADNIRVISAPNRRAEVQFVARQMLQLVKEEDCRYRDIAVIASDIDSYKHYIRAYFDDYHIPFFIDERKPLNQHPVVQLICSALQAVTGGFSHGDIFSYLKTDLVPVERCDVDLLENYCLAFGVRGSDWIGGKDWQFAGQGNGQFDEQRINQIRIKVSGPLLELRDRLCPGDDLDNTVSAEMFARIIFDFLDGLGVRESVGGWIKEAIEKNEPATVDEHRQFYDRLVDIFDELVEVFSGQEINCQDYLAIIDSAFSQLTLALIPPTLDQVLVGSIERSRHPALKAAFLVGATQKQFPVPVSIESILADDDRTVVESADFLLAPTAGQKLAERQYLAYIGFTRPSQFLCVTYPLADDKGSAVARSQFVDDLESLFENLHEKSIAGEQIRIEKVHSETELADLLCSQLGKDAVVPEAKANEQLSNLLDDITSDEQLAELGECVLSAVNYDNCARLDKKMVKKLFGRQIRSSTTRLGTFAACPYQYFARYILKLKEREEFKLEPLDLGIFYHRVLDALLKRITEEGKDFAVIPDEQMLGLLREEISKFVQTNSFISNFVRRSAHNAFIITSAGETLEDCVLAIAEMVRAGKFKPALSEVSFGKAKDSLETMGEYKIGLSDNRQLFLNGKIDRLDVANLGTEKIAIVFDYKRKNKSFSWSKFYYGLDMQLPIYVLAVRNTTGSKTKNAIGAFYMPVEVSPEKAAFDELLKKKDKFAYEAKGIFNGRFFQQLDSSNSNKFYNFFVTKKGDQYGYDNRSGALRPDDFEKVLRFTEKKIIELAEEIISGKIDVWPYRLGTESPCSYCDYKSLCRFDWQINDYNFLESANKHQALEKMGGSDG